DQVGRQTRQSLRAIICKAILDCYILTFDKPALGQALTECGHKVRGTGSCGASEEPNHRHRRLLRARRERPRDRAAEQRDELPASHYSITSSARASSVGGISRSSVLAV